MRWRRSIDRYPGPPDGFEDIEATLESIINGLIAEKRLRYLHGRFARNAIRLYREGPRHYKLEIFGVIWFTARSAAAAIDAAYQFNKEKSPEDDR